MIQSRRPNRSGACRKLSSSIASLLLGQQRRHARKSTRQPVWGSGLQSVERLEQRTLLSAINQFRPEPGLLTSVSESGQLTEADSGSPSSIANRYLDSLAESGTWSADYRDSLIQQTVVENPGGETQNVVFEQRFDDLSVVDARVTITVDAEGRIQRYLSRTFTGSSEELISEPGVPADTALKALADGLQWSLEQDPQTIEADPSGERRTRLSAPELSDSEIIAYLRRTPSRDGLRLSWQIEVLDGHEQTIGQVDAGTGAVLQAIQIPLETDPESGSDDGPSNGPLFPTSETFTLHSRPGARHRIYLDFDGHTTSNTLWNAQFSGGADIVSPPFDTDGNPSSFNAAEHEAIQNVFVQMAEDYAPFDVDVTTEEPLVDDLINQGDPDQRWGIRVVFGGSSSDWFGNAAGGVAYVGSFTWDTDTPTFVFPPDVGNSARNMAEAGSHEVGHTVGLSHDGTSAVEYYAGHNGWAPIMGVAYGKSFSQFSKGEYADADNLEDDLEIISTQNGFDYRIDRYPDNVADAADGPAIPTVGNTLSTGGVISSESDIDLLKFRTGTGPFDMVISTPISSDGNHVSNMLFEAELLDVDGTVVDSAVSSGPENTVSFSGNLSGGTYFLSVNGIGQGDASTGFTEYGSIGEFRVNGTITPLLELTLSKSRIRENAGIAAALGTVTVLGRDPNSGDLAVTISADDLSEVAVPSTVVVPNGATSVSFPIDAVDDTLLDGTQIVQITASSAILDSATATLLVDDFETLTVEFADDQIFENAGPNATSLTVTRSNTDTQPASIFTVVDNEIREFDLNGLLLDTIAVENPDGFTGIEVARDVVTLPSGRLAIFNGSENVYLSQYDRDAATWSHLHLPEISMPELWNGGIAAFGTKAYLTDMTTPAGPSAGLIEVDLVTGTVTRFGDQEPGSRLFASSISQGIVEIDPSNGSVINSFPAPGSPGVSDGLAFDGENLYYLPHQVLTSNVYQLDPDTGAIRDIHDPPGDEVFDGLGFVDGLLYLNDFFDDQVIAYNPVTREIDHIVDVPGAQFFGGQGAIAGITDPDALLVSDSLTSEIWEVDPVTGQKTRIWNHDFTFTDLGLAAVDNEVYVAINVSDEIKIYSREGVYQRSISVPGSIGMQSLGGDGIQGLVPSVREFIDVAVGFDGQIYGLTNDQVTVGVYDPASLNVVQFITVAAPINAITVDSSDRLFGANSSGEVLEFASDGSIVNLQTLPHPADVMIDLDVSFNGDILAGATSGDVFQTTTDLASTPSGFSSGTFGNIYVSFSDYQGRNRGDLPVTLTNSDPSEARFDSSVIIPAGQQSVTIPVDAVDDFLFDGNQIVIAAPEALGYELFGDSLEVLDAESLLLSVSSTVMNESQTVTATLGRENKDGDYDFRSEVSYRNRTAVEIPDLQTVQSEIEVQDLFAQVADINVTLDITHTWNADLDVFLIAPDGQRLEMFSDIGLDGENFINTTLDDEAETRIITGNAPFTGRYRPFDKLSSLDGLSPNGTWTLEITDDNERNVGTLNEWNLDLTLLGLAPITVSISNDNPGKLDVPTEVVIPANKIAVEFPITGIVDGTLGSPEDVMISATYAGYFNSPSQTINVKNGEKPVLTSPGEVAPTAPLFAWNSVGNAEFYDLWIDNQTTGERQIYRNRYLTGTSFQLPFDLPIGQYEAWLSAASPDRDFSLWSDSIVFATVGRPSEVEMIAPRNEVASRFPEFVWSEDPNASHYELWVRDISSGQDQIIYQTDLVGTTFTPTAADINFDQSELELGRYRSWVRSHNAIGQAGPWSEFSEWFIVADIPTPATPAPLGPDFATSNRRPTFSWTEVPDAYFYDLWVRNLTTGEDQIVRESRIVGDSFTPDLDLTNGNYRWWIRALNEQGEASAWSDSLRFSIVDDVPVPDAPTVTGPEFLAPASPLVQWTSSEFAVSYELQVEDITFNRPNVVRVSNISGTQYQITEILRVALYRARVRAYNSEGEAGEWSSWYNFLVTDNGSSESAPVEGTVPEAVPQQPIFDAEPVIPAEMLAAVDSPTKQPAADVEASADATAAKPAGTGEEPSAEMMVMAWSDREWWSKGFDGESRNHLPEASEPTQFADSDSASASAAAPLLLGTAIQRIRRWRKRRRSTRI